MRRRAQHAATARYERADRRRDRRVPRCRDPAGNATWVQRYGDSGDDAGESVLVDSDGTIVAAGNFTGAMNVGTTLTSAGAADLFVMRRQGDGTAIGSVRYGGSGVDAGASRR